MGIEDVVLRQSPVATEDAFAVLEVRLLPNAGVSRSCFDYAGTPPHAQKQ